MSKTPHLVLIATFVLIIGGVPIAQAILDVLDDEKPQALELFGQAPSEKNLRDFEKSLEDNSVFEQKMRPLYQTFAFRSTGELGQKAVPGKDGWAFYHPGLRYLLEPYFADLPADKLEGNNPVDVIADFQQQLAKRNIHLLVVPIPGKASIYPDKLTSQLTPKKAVFTNTLRFIGELRERGIDVLDMNTPMFAAREQSDANGEALYMRMDTHWTGAGIQVAAKALKSHIESLAVLDKAASTTLYHSKKLRIERHGDVPAMTKIPNSKGLFGSESVDVNQITQAANGEPYQDADDAQILWLGDSFSRVFQTDEPGAAGIIANLAYELNRPLASIVNDGGASTLVRQQLAQRSELLAGKKIVVWEFIERDLRFGMRGWQKLDLVVH